MYSHEAIIYQVLNGKNGMPAFGGRLNQTEIEMLQNMSLFQLKIISKIN